MKLLNILLLGTLVSLFSFISNVNSQEVDGTTTYCDNLCQRMNQQAQREELWLQAYLEFSSEQGFDVTSIMPPPPEVREDSEDDESEEKKMCELKIDSVVTDCQAAYAGTTFLSSGSCVILKRIPVFGTSLATSCGSLHTYVGVKAHGWCAAQGQALKLKECN